MRIQRIATLAATAALVISLSPGVASTSLAGRDPTARFSEITLGDDFAPAMLPHAADPSQRMTVFVEMQGDSVADARANAPDNKISDSDKEAIKRDLKSKQDALRPAIEIRGGSVGAGYQAAVNGLRVDIERGKIAAIAALPGVIAVRSIMKYTLDNAVSVPYIGAPAVWNGAAGLRGEGVKIGIIDTGIDYTHANFAGPGTVAAFNTAKATSTLDPNPAFIGPTAPKVKGGTDLVGDDYNASAPAGSPRLIPHPDPNPLDCNGHGSHVAGTAAGFGVNDDGTRYSGPYDSTTPSTAFRIGPGVAPKADLYAIRVFGCAGSTDVVVDAINWAVDNDLDVINMSLGSPFGGADTADALAVNKAMKAGVVVVASAGNSGPARYTTGSPASADGSISVAAVDSTASFPGVKVAFGNATALNTLNANQATVVSGTTYTNVKVLVDNPATPLEDESLGCSVAAYGAVAPSTLVIVNRGSCARVAKAIFGQQAGAAAVAMINNAPGYPPLEGPIFSNPDDGRPYTVTIPFLGIRGADAVIARAGVGPATLTNIAIANPGYRGFASFTSGGPRIGDSALKPDISAPGVSVQSTSIGTGNLGTRLSGTSMAAPHVAGVAALTRQAHPNWKASDVKAAIVNTGDPGQVAAYRTSVGGSGLVQPVGSTRTQTVATTDGRGTNLSFGYRELGETFTASKSITLNNRGSNNSRFNVSVTASSGSPHTVGLSRTSVDIGGGENASIDVRLTVPATTAGDSSAFRQVAGLITFTPATSSDNGGATLRVPYYLVPRAVSDLSTKLDGALNSTTNTSTTARITNSGVIAGSADFYALGFSDKNAGQGSVDLRGVGVQAFDNPSLTDPNRRILIFAINTWERWSNAATNEFDILVDVNADGIDDFAVIGFDLGALTTGSFNGQMASFVLNLRTRKFSTTVFLADAPMNSSTILLPVRSSQLVDATRPAGAIGLSKTANPRFSYHVESFDLLGPAQDATTGIAKYNAWTSSISQGEYVTVAPGTTETSPVSIDAAEWANTPALGLLIATMENRSGPRQTQLITVTPGGGGAGEGQN
jgi:subtilisin family serine protease